MPPQLQPQNQKPVTQSSAGKPQQQANAEQNAQANPKPKHKPMSAGSPEATARIAAALSLPGKQNLSTKSKPAQQQQAKAATQRKETPTGQSEQDTAGQQQLEDGNAQQAGHQSENDPQGDPLNPEDQSAENAEHGLQVDESGDPLAPNDEGDQAGEGEEGADFHVVKIDGKEERVSTAELIKGYERQSDYTKKTLALANERKQVEAVKEEVKDLPLIKKAYQETAETFGRNATLVLRALQDRFMPKAPDVNLLETNPRAYMVQKELFQEAQQFLGGLKTEIGKADALKAAEFNKQRSVSRGKLLTELPEIKDPVYRAKFTNYCYSLGYTPEQVRDTIDNRLLVMAHKSMKFDEMEAARKKLQTNNPRPKVSQSRQAPEDPKAVQQRQERAPIERHKRERTVDSAAAAMQKAGLI